MPQTLERQELHHDGLQPTVNNDKNIQQRVRLSNSNTDKTGTFGHTVDREHM
jgi:hypothetical protein